MILLLRSRHPRAHATPRFRALACCLSMGLALAPAVRAHAQESAAVRVPATFAYKKRAQENYERALLELTGVVTVGFLWYVTTTDIRREYDVGYSWPVFRKKLLGQAFELDTNAFGTNFVGHPIGGTTYYMAARSNHLSVAGSFAISVGGSLLWEYFGEVHEIVSANDMIITPIAGVSIAEPLFQLGAFFDRSSPALRNRILAVVFAPFKSLNDLLDGRSLARAQAFDEHGFPADEWHQFDLRLGAATAFQSATEPAGRTAIGHALRLSLGAQLARLPGYDGDGEYSLFFADANVSSVRLDADIAPSGLVDFNLETQFAFAGHYFRDARYDESGGLWGHGALLGLTTGYQYALHDYDRDRDRPRDHVATVRPLGLMLEHRLAFGAGRLETRLVASGAFGGVHPYAQPEYLRAPEVDELPVVLAEHLYYFGLGAQLLAGMCLDVGPFEAAVTWRFESYSALSTPISIGDRRSLLEARVGSAVGDSPVRVSLVAQRRTRAGHMGQARAGRNELNLSFELGVRY